jgi:hypothetical protein
MRITSKAGLLPNTEVEFIYDGKTVRLVKTDHGKVSRGARLVAHMRGRGSGSMTTDQIMALTRRR